MAQIDVTDTSCPTEEYPELFEGPEKTLTLCFKQRRIDGKSLRLIPREAWAGVLKHAKCEIISEIHSAPVEFKPKKKDSLSCSRAVRAYMLSESSLFVTDTSLVLKTCGRTTPLAALEPILDLAVPTWRQKKEPEKYMQYATFTRLGYMRPNEQVEPHTSWEQEVAHMNKFFFGEDMILGSQGTSQQHVYVSNYMPKNEVVDAFSTQVALTDLDTSESLRRYGSMPSDLAPLKTAWQQLHGNEKRSVAANPALDEFFFEPIGYSSNAVFGKNYTTIHCTPQPGCTYLSVESSMALTREGRHQFASAAADLCKADTLAVTELALSSALFSGEAPKVPGFDLQRSSQTVGSFACAHHHYKRTQIMPPWLRQPDMSPVSTVMSSAGSPLAFPDDPCDAAEEFTALPPPACGDDEPLPIIAVDRVEAAPASAAEMFLGRSSHIPKDIPVALLDTSCLRRQAETWHRLLPRVEPFYAVKCNPSPAIVKTLWEMWKEQGGGGFDCASPSEMQLVLSLPGLDPADHIVYANPCKQGTAVKFAQEVGVRRLVFDNSAELQKLAKLYPSAELLIRVQTDDSLAQCPLSNKFGVAPADCEQLLSEAQALGLTVIGASFHVGSGCSQRGAFRGALERARHVFDVAEKKGLRFTLLDIGGGFPGWDEAEQATFADHAEDISNMLEKLFPSRDIRVIAEPGRFFVASAQSMLTTVVSVAETSSGCRYYLNDGLYGSFNCLLYDHATVPQPIILRNGHQLPEEQVSTPFAGNCTIFGPTCDGFDVITESMAMPQLQVEDRLLFPNMGAYTSAASTSFNGFAPAVCFTYQSKTVDAA
jgi:ornithine decarboxylase